MRLLEDEDAHLLHVGMYVGNGSYPGAVFQVMNAPRGEWVHVQWVSGADGPQSLDALVRLTVIMWNPIVALPVGA